jgi:predicted nucleic acid-binding protein
VQEELNMELKKFVEEENFGGTFESLPDGDTFITIAETDVEAIEVEFEDKKKTRFKLKTKDKEYMVGPQVMRGIEAAIKKKSDCKRVRITKTGEKLNTHYTVVPVIE